MIIFMKSIEKLINLPIIISDPLKNFSCQSHEFLKGPKKEIT